MTDPINSQIKAALRSYISGSLLGGQEIADDDDLLLTGLVDSLGVMSLVEFMEAEFAFKIPFDDVIIENFSTLEAMSFYVTARRSAHA